MATQILGMLWAFGQVSKYLFHNLAFIVTESVVHTPRLHTRCHAMANPIIYLFLKC
jgi:hypothetical protein